MTRKEHILLIGVGVVALLLLPVFSMGQSVQATAADLIAGFEKFSPVPYWDVSRWSWGYGTPAPGSTGIITESQAKQELYAHIQSDYDYLRPLITRPLSVYQWAALLSFSYNLGAGNADNLVYNINSGNDAALHSQWMLYVYADGLSNEGLADRRAAEWVEWQS